MEVVKTEIKDHPILYNGQMVNTMLAGQKDETRRVPFERYLKWKPGNLIWVRETFVIENTREYAGMINYTIPKDRPIKIIENEWDGKYELIPHYRATEPEPNITDCEDGITRWQPNIFMFKWCCRLWLKILSIKKQKWDDIQNYEIKNEGIQSCIAVGCPTFKIAWAELWDGINGQRHGGRYASKNKPTVAAIKFEVIKGIKDVKKTKV